MDDNSNVTQSVASGDSPQPASEAAQQSDYGQLQSEVENQMGLNDEVAQDDDGTSEVADQIDAAVANGQISKTDAQSLKKKYSLKVDGEEFEEELDLNDDEAVKRHMQKSRAFDKRLKEFGNYKSQVDQLIEMLEKDPEAVLEKMGKDVDSLAQKRLERKIEEMKKSPEQIEKEKMSKELEELRAEKKKIKEEAEKSELEKLRNEQAQQIENDISSALDSAKSMLPKRNPLVLQRISATMLSAMKNGYPNVSAKDVIPLVEKQWKQELNEFFAVLPEETIENLVGKQNLDRVRKTRVAQKKVETATAKQVTSQATTGQKKESTEEPSRKLRMRDFFKD